ncbi:MAG: DNA polymerase IV [bacterium]|nr:DNA polymerase IV [bacterium]
MAERALRLCRDCAHLFEPAAAADRCPECGSPRLFGHPEVADLAIAHIDCDAFYAAVEKRDNPDLANKPVIVGGGRRGVVSACCYIARTRGVHSAMPMFKAVKACPDAVVIRPDMEKYQRLGREIRGMMKDTTPLVEALSVDEAFLDLSGTQALHRAAPAQTLVRLVNRIEREAGVTASVGLSYNKFLAKTASDLDKPRGFAAIGRAEALDFLSPRPVSSIWGVGKSLRRRLERDGLKTIGQLRRIDEQELIARYGKIGARLARLSNGRDARPVDPSPGAKSISAETTLAQDTKRADELARRLWPLSEKVAKRLKRQELAAAGVTLKLKTSSFRIVTRSRTLPAPTQLAETLYQAALPLLEDQCDGRSFRLIGVGTSRLADPPSPLQTDLLDDGRDASAAEVERAMDAVREKFGDPAIRKGRSLLGKKTSGPGGRTSK